MHLNLLLTHELVLLFFHQTKLPFWIPMFDWYLISYQFPCFQHIHQALFVPTLLHFDISILILIIKSLVDTPFDHSWTLFWTYTVLSYRIILGHNILPLLQLLCLFRCHTSWCKFLWSSIFEWALSVIDRIDMTLFLDSRFILKALCSWAPLYIWSLSAVSRQNLVKVFIELDVYDLVPWVGRHLIQEELLLTWWNINLSFPLLLISQHSEILVCVGKLLSLSWGQCPVIVYSLLRTLLRLYRGSPRSKWNERPFTRTLLASFSLTHLYLIDK